MAPAIGRPALDNGSYGSIPGDLVAPPPQNIHAASTGGAGFCGGFHADISFFLIRFYEHNYAPPVG